MKPNTPVQEFGQSDHEDDVLHEVQVVQDGPAQELERVANPRHRRHLEEPEDRAILQPPLQPEEASVLDIVVKCLCGAAGLLDGNWQISSINSKFVMHSKFL